MNQPTNTKLATGSRAPAYLFKAMLIAGVVATSAAARADEMAAADLAANVGVRRQAIQLFSSGQAAAAVTYISANLKTQSEATLKQGGIADELLAEAFLLRNSDSRNGGLADAAAAAAISLANQIPATDAATTNMLAHLLSQYGMYCEVKLRQPSLAVSYYQAALARNPSDAIASFRLGRLQKKMGPNG